MLTERVVGTGTELRLRADKHAALGDPVRLAIVDALWLGDLSPTQLQEQLSMSSNLLAHHLKVLESVGFLTRRRSEGDRRRTYLRLVWSAAADLLPRAGPRWEEPTDARPTGRVVFVCTANTARSQLAEALWRRACALSAASAGTRPGDRVDPVAVATARRHGLSLRGHTPRSVENVLVAGDLVVTVCDSAREELPTAPTVHWSVPDPVRVGTPAAFEAALTQLDERVGLLAGHLSASP